jgi:hypothetical protein
MKRWNLEDVMWVVDGSMIEDLPTEQCITTALQNLNFEFEIRNSSSGFTAESMYMWRDEGAGPTVAYGSQNFVRFFIKNIPCIPGPYPHNHEQTALLSSVSYMSRIRAKWLMNKDFIFLPIGSLIEQPEKPFELFNSDSVFIKDNQAFKRFSGQVVEKQKFLETIQFLQDVHKLESSDLIIIAGPKKLLSEHRFVIVGGEVIAHSTYMEDGNISIKEEVPLDVLTLAKDFAGQKLFSFPYTVDFGVINELGKRRARVIELNSFSCAGLYACDLEKVVLTVSQKALDDYHKYQEESYY